MNRRKQEKQSSAKRTVISLLVTFVAIQIIAGLWFEYGAPRVRFGFLFRQIEQNQTSEPVILCLGSSRVGVAIQSGEDGKLANLGLPLGDLSTSRYALEKALAAGMKPTHLILETTPENCNSHNFNWESQIKHQLRWQDVAGNVSIVLQPYFWKQKLLPLYVHRKGFWNEVGRQASAIFTSKKKPAPATSWQEVLRQPQDADGQEHHAGQITQHLSKAFANYATGGEPERCLVAILKRCEKEKIQVLLVSPPVHESARGYCTPAVEQEFQSFIARFTQDERVRYLDFRRDQPNQNFLDYTHLSPTGAAKFSQSMMTMLKQSPENAGQKASK